MGSTPSRRDINRRWRVLPIHAAPTARQEGGRTSGDHHVEAAHLRRTLRRNGTRRRAGAAGLPDPYYSLSFETYAYDVDTYAVIHSAAGVYSGPASVADPYLGMTAGGTPTPFIGAAAHGANGVYATGGGSIEYYFAVTGPAPVVVPLSAHIIIDATVGSGAFDYGGGGVDIYTDLSDVSRSATPTMAGRSRQVR